MKAPVTKEDAIRQAIREGAAGDFCDVAEVVKKKFGLTVGSGLVEEVYHQLQNDRENSEAHPSRDPKDAMLKFAGLGLVGKVPETATKTESSEIAPTLDRERILEFVQQMGGFSAARDAITKLEQSMKTLMK